MRKLLWIVFSLWFCGLLAAFADTLSLADGTTVSGDIVSYNDNGIILRQGADKYSDRVPWIKLSQDTLKHLAENPKIEPFVQPFIEVAPRAQSPKPAVQISDMSQVRLARPASGSLFAGLLSSPLGLVVLLLIYAANLFAAHEIAVYRGKPLGTVIGVSAVLPILGPIIFLSMVPPAVPVAPGEEAPAEAPSIEAAPAESPPAAESPSAGAPALPSRPHAPAHTYALPGHKPGEISIVAASWSAEGQAEPPPPQIFQRGQFMFNRRFFETRFPGFFGSMRNEEDRGKDLIIKTAKGQFTVERVARVTNNDAHFEVLQDGAKQDVVVVFSDIQEVRLQAKPAA